MPLADGKLKPDSLAVQLGFTLAEHPQGFKDKGAPP